MHGPGELRAPPASASLTRGVVPRTFESFQEPAYRWYWGGSMAQMAAMNMEMMGRLWFIYRLTSLPVMLGAAAFSVSLPSLLLSLFGGVIADRVEKRKVLALTQAAAALVALAIGLFITLGSITWVHLIVAGFLKGTTQAFMMPARQAIIPEIVGERRVTNAVSLNAAGQNINRLFAPALSGFLIAQFGIASVYYVTVALYLLAVVTTLALPRTSVAAGERRGAWRHIGDGLHYIRANPSILTLLLVSLVIGVLSWPVQTLLPIFTEDVLRVGPQGLGLLMSVTGIGSLVGSVILASMGDKRRGLLFLHTTVIMGVALAAFAFSRSYPLSLALMAFLGLGMAGRMALSTSLVQTYTHETYRGRVFSVYMMEWGLTSFGTFIVSILAGFVSIQWTIGGMALLLLLLTGYAYACLPRLRRMD